jgi:hypothetical protein
LPAYLKHSTATILRIYALYEPLRTLFYIGGGMSSLGLLGVLRFLYFWWVGFGQGHVQSLLVSAVLLIIGFQVLVLGIIADLISVNRRLNEEILYRMKHQAACSADEELAMLSDQGSCQTILRHC